MLWRQRFCEFTTQSWPRWGVPTVIIAVTRVDGLSSLMMILARLYSTMGAQMTQGSVLGRMFLL
jgi:hypothetical protein